MYKAHNKSELGSYFMLKNIHTVCCLLSLLSLLCDAPATMPTMQQKFRTDFSSLLTFSVKEYSCLMIILPHVDRHFPFGHCIIVENF